MNLPNPNLSHTSDTLAHAADVASTAVVDSSGFVADAAEHVAGAALNAAVPFAGSIARYLWSRNRTVAVLVAGVALGYGAYRWWSARDEASGDTGSAGESAPVRGKLDDGKPLVTSSNNGASELTASAV